MQKKRPQPGVIHPLPPAPHFVGRETELASLHARWRDGFRGVLALVGLGGAGKTAVVARFLDELGSPDFEFPPNRLFVWSFYQEPDSGLFLDEAYRYFAEDAGPLTSAKGGGILHLLHSALAVGGPHLLVLDGLERVQRQEDSYGRIEDPLLKGLIGRLAAGVGETTALITSRFPLTDLAPQLGTGYRLVPVAAIDGESARALLRRRGVAGEDATLNALVDAYGAHPLTLDHLGGIIGQFLGGNAHRAPEAPALSAGGGDRQALRLARLLHAYEAHLPPAELALLCRLCLLRRNLTEEQIRDIFQCSPTVHARTVRQLVEQIGRIQVTPESNPIDVKDYARAVCHALEAALSTGPLAGPSAAFRSEVIAAVASAVALPESGNEAEFGALAQAYAAASTLVESDLLPLSAEDRASLRELFARYRELRCNPLLPFCLPLDPTLKEAFDKLG